MENQTLTAGLTAEQIQAIYFDSTALVEAPEKVFRLNIGGYRYYYTFDEAQNPSFYVSVTTFIKKTMPTSPQLIKWIAERGYDESLEESADRAAYGTFLHIQLGSLIISKAYDLDTVRTKLENYIVSEKLPAKFLNYEEDFKKDILSFAQFMIDYKVNPLAIEIVLTHPDGYAGAIDLVAEITIEEKGFYGETYKSGVNAGQPKESKKDKTITAIIDFKSGRKGFWEEHEIQLAAYREMWNNHFSKKIDKLFNWSPKDWRNKPTYNFKDQTESESANKLPYLISLMKLEDSKRDNRIIMPKGIIDLTQNDLSDNILDISLTEAVIKMQEKGKNNPLEEVSQERDINIPLDDNNSLNRLF